MKMKNEQTERNVASDFNSIDFQSVNPLNVRLNMLSGNLLPMTADLSFSIFWKIYSSLLWLLLFVHTIALIYGCMHVPQEVILKDSIVCLVVIVEEVFMIARLYMHRKLLQKIIQKLNMLLIQDEIMKNIITTTLDTVKNPLRFYLVSGTFSITVWTCAPLFLILKKNVFFYEDYNVPVGYFNEPFSVKEFICGSFLILLGHLCSFYKKVSVDIYMIHLILLVTVLHRYIGLKLTTIFRGNNSYVRNFRTNNSSEINKLAKEEVRILCRHHKSVIHISLMLKQLLSLTFSMTYIMSIIRFTFTAILLNESSSILLVELVMIIMYVCGVIVQLYILCFSVQMLLDASTEITDKAFHEKWYHFEHSIKRIFISVIIANKLEFKLATCGKFNLSLSSFSVILNQAYSIALLILRLN